MKIAYKVLRSLVLVIVAAQLTACTWVKLTSEGDNVAVLSAGEVAACERLGDITVSVLSRVGVERSRSKVEAELQTLARNMAAERGGDAITPTSEVADGQRDYDLYRCRP